MNGDLDMSWIQEYSRIHSVKEIMNREELDSIVLQTIYMKTNLEITKIDKEEIILDNAINRCISKEQLLKIIQTKKVIENTLAQNSDHVPMSNYRPELPAKYKLFDMLLYTVDLDPKDIQKYVNGECKENARLKSIPIIDKIVIRPSLFIFHSLHTFYIFFVEIATETIPIKPILKTQQPDNKKIKQTKKVRIAENENTVIIRKMPKKTRKVWGITTLSAK